MRNTTERSLAVACLLLAGTTVAFAAKSNIIVFMADDMGYADPGFTGSKDVERFVLIALKRRGTETTE